MFLHMQAVTLIMISLEIFGIFSLRLFQNVKQNLYFSLYFIQKIEIFEDLK